jgi:hypothetical protein
MSGRERYPQTHFVTIRQRKRGTAEAMRRMNNKLHRSGSLENQTSMGPQTTMHIPGGESTYRSQTLSTDHLSESAGVRDGLDQQSGGAVACAGPWSERTSIITERVMLAKVS